MIYVALLRGINVGGNSKVDMKQLAACFSAAGLSAVSTYINSGNVIFASPKSAQQLVPELESVIAQTFGFTVKVLLRTIDDISAICRALPDDWQNNADMKCDVLFLWDEVNQAATLDALKLKDDIEDGVYLAAGGAILWRIDRPNVTKSRVLKLIGTPLYKQMTIRNCNTVRTLHKKMALVTDTST